MTIGEIRSFGAGSCFNRSLMPAFFGIYRSCFEETTSHCVAGLWLGPIVKLQQESMALCGSSTERESTHQMLNLRDI